MLLFASGAAAQNNQVSWWAFDMGLGASRMSNSMLTSLMGESCIGAAREGNTILTAGFLGDPSLWQTVVSVAEHSPIPGAYALHQNYPNPFNPSTTICYGLPNRAHVTLAVFNTLGQQVAQIVNSDMEGGYHEVKFDGIGLSSGVYFYRLEAGSFIQTRKLLLLK